MKTTLKDPYSIAFMKKYFVNLLSEGNFGSFKKAKQNFPVLGKIADKLSPHEIEYLIDKIENLL